jgi:hypothetical protein
LGELLANHKWPLCQAFGYGGLLFLDDIDAKIGRKYSIRLDQMAGTLAIGSEDWKNRASRD